MFLSKNYDFIEYLFSNGFKPEDIIDSFKSINIAKNKGEEISFIDENTTIFEGNSTTKEVKIYERSSTLRKAAVEYYTQNGRIKCKACCFDFEDFYGEYGKGFIEIHHLTPVFMFNENDLKKTIENALKNTIPICSNCHRMIHRQREFPITLQTLKTYINKTCIFVNRITCSNVPLKLAL